MVTDHLIRLTYDLADEIAIMEVLTQKSLVCVSQELFDIDLLRRD